MERPGGGLPNPENAVCGALLLISLWLAFRNCVQEWFNCGHWPANGQHISSQLRGKVLKALSGEVAEWLNAAVC